MTRSQRAASLLTLLVVAGMVAGVLLTAGRTNGSQREVLSTIDSAGSRTILVRLEPDAGVTLTDTLRLETLTNLEWVGAFGTAQDVTNPLISGQTATATRTVLTPDLSAIAGTWSPAAAGQALATPTAAADLALYDSVGYVAGTSATATVTHVMSLPSYLEFMDPIVLIPISAGDTQAGELAAVIVAVVDQPANVAATADAIVTLLHPTRTENVSVQTSGVLTELQASIQAQLGGSGRALVLGTFAILAALVTALLYGLVMIRRRDYGRRRALGATRALIITLILANTAIVALAGVVLGAACGLTALTVMADPHPTWQFTLATTILAVLASLLGALIPATAASRRDPLTELRVP